MAYGFEPVKHAQGGVIRPNNFSNYTIDSGYGTAIYRGDLVKIVEGTLELAAPGDTTLVGVFWGCSYKKSNGEVVFSKYWPASQVATDIKADVYDDPNLVFRVQADQVGTAIAQNYVGSSTDAWAVGTPDTVNTQSGAYLDSSGSFGASAANLKVVGSGEPDANFTAVATTMDVLVQINEHLWKGTGGTAIS